MKRPLGVMTRPTVNQTTSPAGSKKSICSNALPNERRPSSSARSWSCSDPASASEALALRVSMSTISGRSVKSPSRLVTKVVSTSFLRPTALKTTVPFGKNSEAISTADTTTPPGLPRRSRIT